MKHIKKKFSFERKMNELELESLAKNAVSIDKKMLSSGVKIPKGYRAILQTDDGTGITAFSYKHNGINYIIPEPDPILIYFHTAQIYLRPIDEIKVKLFEAYSEDEIISEKIKQNFYDYYSATCSYVIMLFTAVEACLNKLIPDDFQHKIEKSSRTELYNKEQIERHLPFDVKIKEIIPRVIGRNFYEHFPLKKTKIEGLKTFRDNIVHTKRNKDGQTPYDYIYKRALNFDYIGTIEAVRDFINYYIPDYIEQCECGVDY